MVVSFIEVFDAPQIKRGSRIRDQVIIDNREFTMSNISRKSTTVTEEFCRGQWNG